VKVTRMKTYRRFLLPLIGVATTLIALGYGNRSPEPRQVTWEDVRSQARQGGYRLINTEDLWKLFQSNSKPFLLVDTRQDWEYRTGHIRGARNFPMEPTWLSRWRNKAALEQFLGPDKERLIIFY